MLRTLDSLFGSTIHSLDGDLGHIRDFLFDDRGWTVRYFVVETGGYLSSQEVLISPSSARQ
ncbi:MAG: PRC-barrel domain containing protein, partial [Acidobacteria bacterium]|nr:PRC-barrel domain containing protein [Acidobacteriota bacterium]